MPKLPRLPLYAKNNRAYTMSAKAGQAEILLYDVIYPFYGISAKQFHADLKALGDIRVINLRINSPGGSITEGIAIHSILKRQTAKVIAHVDGIAASMASVVAMAADEIVMAEGSYMMIHNPLGAVAGEAGDMREYADLLDKMKQQLVSIYANRSKQSAEIVSELMDDETWFTPQEAIDAGFADRSSPELALAASIDPKMFFHTPSQFRNQGEYPVSTSKTELETKTPDQVKAELVAANKDYSDRFGAELAAKWGPLGESKPLLDCYGEFVAKLRKDHEAALSANDTAHAAAVSDLQSKLAEAEKKAADAEERLSSLSLGEKTPVSGTPPAKPNAKPASGLTATQEAFKAEFELPKRKKE